ncbi:armadillo-type protein [Ampelomyces quisqualis]|uniref:Armadillo-type protein n=1 Tax=Ampelomyces quisqualis TaxID=50730 RepID=A0A6A5QQZ5_AMPQU|nr:armadillo-type protein [Ampelomyces quisqualis]
MDAATRVLARNMSARGGIALGNGNGSGDPDRPVKPWPLSIWNNTSTTASSSPLTFGFGSAHRDSSRPREHASFDLQDGKTGSGSLVPDSETEWRPTRPAWPEPATSTNRSSGASPTRKPSVVQAQPSQPYSEPSPSSFFTAPRPSLVGSSALSNPPQPLLDPTSTNFTSSRQVDALTTSFANFGFSQPDISQQRPDTASLHSPNDVAAPEYFASSSGAPSRNGSLPPSRHGAEPAQYSQPGDAYARFSQAAPRQASSFSYANGRSFQERSASIQSESFYTLSRLAVEQEQEARLPHRQSLSTNAFAPNYTHSAADFQVARESYSDAQPAARTDVATYSNGAYTPDSYPNGQGSDPNVQFQNFQFDTRSAPNGTGVRQSPFYSHINTPPVYDRLNPYTSEQTLSHPNNLALIQNKLAGYQIQQERRNYIPHNQFHQQPFQHMIPSAQLRHPYPYHFSSHNTMPISAIPPHMAMATISPMMPAPHPPRGPREQQMSDGPTVLSLKLAEFRRDVKITTKHWELSDLYQDVVEFAGDQHGSRFIQQRLETANSEVKEKIFRELEPNSIQLMQDVFGNYVIQKFFEHGDQTQKKILADKMKGRISALSNQMYACRVIQKALEHVLVHQQAAIAKELEKNVLKNIKDQNGNHVIQKVIDLVPMEHLHNIVESCKGHIGGLALNSYGCRVVQRLLEKVPEPQRRFLLTELHAEGGKLIIDSYGNYVTQHVIEHGLPEDRAKVVSLVTANFRTYSMHKFASNVVERCLVCGNDEQRRMLVDALITKKKPGENNVLDLLKDGYGNYVIQKLLETLRREDYNVLVTAVKPELEKANKLIASRHAGAVEKKMYRFDRVDSPTMPREASESNEVPPTPALSSSAQSPQSSSAPSTNTSTAGDHVHSSTPTPKETTLPVNGVSIEETTL